VIADLALLPFALALGIGIFIGMEGVFEQDRVATPGGALGGGLALAASYGLPQLRKRFVGERERMITSIGQDAESHTSLQTRSSNC
jgi:hypothetical protein